MLAVLSPAKKLDFTPAPADVEESFPHFQKDANTLARTARRLSKDALKRLMSISDDLATLNKARFKGFQDASDTTNSKQAMLVFAGDTYQGLQAAGFDAADRAWAQDRLRILSGLYGLLRPLDRIQPYRLEMGSRLANAKGPTLYAYWADRLARALDAAADGGPVVNLASMEYFRAANEPAMQSPVIHVDFREERNGELKMISFFAKRARGSMARFMTLNRVDRAEGLKDFNYDGYAHRADLSEPGRLVFTRKAA